MPTKRAYSGPPISTAWHSAMMAMPCLPAMTKPPSPRYAKSTPAAFAAPTFHHTGSATGSAPNAASSSGTTTPTTASMAHRACSSSSST